MLILIVEVVVTPIIVQNGIEIIEAIYTIELTADHQQNLLNKNGLTVFLSNQQ